MLPNPRPWASPQVRATKYALFSVYLSILGLSSYPALHVTHRMSSSMGLTSKRGSRRLNTQRWVWLVGPLWSAWSAWFDALAGAFAARGACVAYGPGPLELIAKAFTWLTLPHADRSTNSFAYSAALNLPPQGVDSAHPRSFYILLDTPRYHGFTAHPVFALTGSETRHRLGWACLPGPSNNPHLKHFLLTAALAAYKSGAGR